MQLNHSEILFKSVSETGAPSEGAERKGVSELGTDHTQMLM